MGGSYIHPKTCPAAPGARQGIIVSGASVKARAEFGCSTQTVSLDCGCGADINTALQKASVPLVCGMVILYMIAKAVAGQPLPTWLPGWRWRQDSTLSSISEMMAQGGAVIYVRIGLLGQA